MCKLKFLVWLKTSSILIGYVCFIWPHEITQILQCENIFKYSMIEFTHDDKAACIVILMFYLFIWFTSGANCFNCRLRFNNIHSVQTCLEIWDWFTKNIICVMVLIGKLEFQDSLSTFKFQVYLCFKSTILESAWYSKVGTASNMLFGFAALYLNFTPTC